MPIPVINNNFNYYVEHVFNIRDSEHKPGTNRYTFRHNEQWRHISRDRRWFGIRSIKSIQAPRYVAIHFAIGIAPNPAKKPVSTIPMRLSFVTNPRSTITSINESINEQRRRTYQYYEYAKLYPNLGPFDFAARLYATNGAFEITLERDVVGEHRRIMFPKDYTELSDDALELFGVTDEFLHELSDVSTKAELDKFKAKYREYMKKVDLIFESEKDAVWLTSILFKCKWNDGELIIHSSLSDLSHGRIIGFTDSTYTPPKLFKIENNDESFWIDIYDSYGRPIDLDVNVCDALLIEAILYA